MLPAARRVLVRKRPTYFYSSEGVPCPRRGDGGKQGGGGGAHAAAAGSKGSKGGKGKGAVVTSTSCPGICIGAPVGCLLGPSPGVTATACGWLGGTERHRACSGWHCTLHVPPNGLALDLRFHSQCHS